MHSSRLVAIIGHVSSLQPATALIGVAILALARWLPSEEGAAVALSRTGCVEGSAAPATPLGIAPECARRVEIADRHT